MTPEGEFTGEGDDRQGQFTIKGVVKGTEVIACILYMYILKGIKKCKIHSHNFSVRYLLLLN